MDKGRHHRISVLFHTTAHEAKFAQDKSLVRKNVNTVVLMFSGSC